MGVFEIHTIGAGYYLEKVLTAVAFVLSDEGGFRIAIKIAILCAILGLALRATITSDLKQTIQWGLSVTIFISLFFTTRATVYIVDRLPDRYGNTSAPRKVDNVPWGLAVVGWATSSVGKTIAERFDMAFSSVFVNQAYGDTGLLFGSKIVEDMSKLRISNSELKSLMLKFYRQCIVPDVNMGNARANGYTVSDLKNTNDLIGFLKNHASKTRLIHVNAKIKQSVPDTSTYGTLLGRTSIQETSLNDYISCNKAIGHISNMLDYEMNGQMPNLASRFFSHFYPDSKINEDKNTLFASVLKDSYKIFIKDSKEAKDLLIQNVMINSIKDSVASSYGKVSTEEMTKASFHSVSEIFQKFIPILRAIFECLFYGVSPVIILLLMTPIGIEVLKNYGFGFIYLQLWLPMYSILFSITQHWARFSAAGIDHLTFSTQPQIAAINADISMVSGYMLAMIPVLAIFITKGLVSSIGNMANSMMYIPQTAAVQSAEQSVKGNYSLGNTNIDTHAYDTLNAHKFDDNYSWLSGMKSWAMMSGSVQKEYADGRQGMDIMPSPANLGGLNIVTSNMIGGKIESTETDLTNKADRYAHSSNESLTHGMSTFFGYNQQASQHESAVKSLQQNFTAEERQSFDTTKAFVEKLAKDHGISADLALRVTGMASSPKILPFSASAELSGTTGARTAYNEAKEAFKDEKFAENFSNTVSMIETKSHQSQIGQSKDLTDSISTDFKQAHQEDRNYAKTMEELHSLQETKSAYQTRSTEITQNLNNQFLEYSIAKYGHDAFEQAVRRDPAEARKMAEGFIETLKLPDLVQIKTKAQFADKHQLQGLKNTTFAPEEVQAAQQKQADGRTEIITTQAVPKELIKLEDDPQKTDSEKTLNAIAKTNFALQSKRDEQKTRVGEKIDTGQKSIDKKSDALKIGKKT